MNDSEKAVQRLTNEERVAKVQREKKKTAFQLTMLSVIGVLTFLLLWQLAVAAGLLPSRYVPMPSKVVELFFLKWTDPNPDGAGLGAHIISSQQVALSGFFLAVAPYSAGVLDPHYHHMAGAGLKGKGIYRIFLRVCSLRYQRLHGNPADKRDSHQCGENLRGLKLYYLQDHRGPLRHDHDRNAEGKGRVIVCVKSHRKSIFYYFSFRPVRKHMSVKISITFVS